MKTENQERVFKFKKDGKEVSLSDPNPEFTASEVVKFYAHQYPELTTATFGAPTMDDGKAIYEVKTNLGTKA